MADDTKTFSQKTRDQVRDDYTRTIKAGLIDRGISNPNVSQGSLDYLKGDIFGAIVEDVENQIEIKANDAIVDTAGKNDPEALQRLTRIVGLDLRPAGPSIGSLVIATSVAVPVSVPIGAQLIDDAGLTYEVTAPGPYQSEDLVPIRAVDKGEATNLAAGATLRWASPPPFVQQTATVATGGLTGGVNQEDIEGLRQRILAYYGSAPGGGNWGQVARVAEESSTFVGRAFVYCGVYGGNTMHVAVVRAPTTTNKSRAVNQTVIDQVIKPAVLAEFPTFADITVTTTADYPVDVSMELSLPTSTRASPPGPGGGWIDGNPWPTPMPLTGVAQVTSVISSVEFVVESEATPAIGTHIVYISPVDFYVYHGVIQERTDLGPDVWRIKVDTAFLSERATSTLIQVGDWIFPDAERMDSYIVALMNTFAALGPGEKTNASGLLPRALRNPLDIYDSPYDVTGTAIRQMFLAGSEVRDVKFLVTPGAVPLAPNYQVPPNIATPRKLAFYAKV